MSNKIWWYVSAVVAMIIGIGLVAFVELNAPAPAAPSKLSVTTNGLDAQGNSTMLQWIGFIIFFCGLFVVLWISGALAAMVAAVQNLRKPTVPTPVPQVEPAGPPQTENQQGSALPPGT